MSTLELGSAQSLTATAKGPLAPGAKPLELRYRQIHLDFHTSEDIPGIGEQFDPEEFAATLERARVDSVTLFSRCHHGWLYYESKAFPERIHPHLVYRNLLGDQIEACHKRNIRTPIYLSVQWDNLTATHHPEWRVLTPEGQLSGTPPFVAGFYRNLCVNSPWRDFLKASIKELFEMFPVDGFFIDIVGVLDCSCPYCLAGMLKQGLDPTQRADRMTYARQLNTEFKMDMTRTIRQFSADCSIFYNAGHVGPYNRESLAAYTHLEIESVPSGGWGYIHFPMTIRFARNIGVDCLGQTGKFQSLWGDFHSFKNKAALEYEVFRMLALNAKCMVGDQLHPSGKICPHVYDLIGHVYKQVERKEPWCKGAEAVTEIGVLTPEEFFGSKIPAAIAGEISPSTAGAVRMLEESAQQFDILDSKSDFSRYKMLILPDRIIVSDALAAKLKKFLADGGSIIASYESGINENLDAFAMDELGVRLLRRNPIEPEKAPPRSAGFECDDYTDYLMPGDQIGAGLPPTEHVMYMKAAQVAALPGTEVLGNVMAPYFDRTWRHFCSHLQSPSSGKVIQPGVVRKGRVIYFAHPIFMQYRRCAPRWCKTMLLNAINLLLGQPLLTHNGPTTVQATVNAQPGEKRWVVHLLHYIPERRGQELDTIEDVIALYDLSVSLKVPQAARAVTCVPEGIPVDFKMEQGRVNFILPKLNGHQMIEIQF